MTQHFNIQISIQRVDEPEPMHDKNGYELKAPGGAPRMTERRVTKVLELAVTADDERDAYAKAHRMLSASEPEWTVDGVLSGPPGVRGAEEEHLHRASCHGAIGELQCGFPPGPTI